jgi:predicted SAM-dependent methyltransferase
MTHSDSRGRRQLNLACGHVLKPEAQGWVNLDKIEGPGIFTAEVPPIPFEDEYFDHILCSHFLEHIPAGDQTIFLMNECWRVLRPGGTMHVEVPYWNSEAYVQDPTHVQPWNADKFRYFTSEFEYLRYGIKVWRSAKAEKTSFWEVKADSVK